MGLNANLLVFKYDIPKFSYKTSDFSYKSYGLLGQDINTLFFYSSLFLASLVFKN